MMNLRTISLSSQIANDSFEEFTIGKDRILISKISDHQTWASELLSEYNRNRGRIFTSHKINGRWENYYLPIDLVPKLRSVAYSDGMPPRAQIYADMILETIKEEQQ